MREGALSSRGSAFSRNDQPDEDTALIEFSPEEWTAVRLSLRIALTATLASLPLGIFIAYALARWRFPGKVLLDGFIHLPLVLPPVVTGYVLLMLFGRRGPLGALLAEHLGIVLSFRWTGAALACAVMGFPLLVRPIRLSIEAIDRRLEDAAGTLGANRLWTFTLVTLPLALPGLLVGSILCFAKALGEFGATITFVSNIPGETQTISAVIYTYTQVPGGDEGAWRLTIVSIVIALGALTISELMQRGVDRRMAGSE
jgi:molybdate transport system permease protein